MERQVREKKTYEDNPLPNVFMKELDPIVTRLSKDELLSRCLKGTTQNQNEAANGMSWSRCPKIKFCGARHCVHSCFMPVCETIGLFNTGVGSLAEIMGMCGITPGANTMKVLRQQDKKKLSLLQRKSVLSVKINEENHTLNERQKQTRMRIKLEHSV